MNRTFLARLLLGISGALSIWLTPAGAQTSTMTTSFYTNRLNGHRTSSGEVFNNNRLTAAHKTLPLGTRLRLRNPKNGRTVVVRVTDRGPNVAGRELSVTRRAAQQLGFVRAGVTSVEVTQLGSTPRRRTLR